MTQQTHEARSASSSAPNETSLAARPPSPVVLPTDVAEAIVAQIAQMLATQTVIHLSQNAKGRAQFELRLPYASVEVAKAQVRQDVDDLIAQIRQAVKDAHLLLASDDDL